MGDIRPVGEPRANVSRGSSVKLSLLTFVLVTGLIRRLVYDSTMFQAAEVKHANAAIGATGDEYIYTACTESYVEDFLVVCD